MFLKLHKQMFCTIDEWIEMTIEMIREMEESTKCELEKKIETFNLESKTPPPLR